MDAVLAAIGGEKRFVTVHGPLMEKERSYYGMLRDNTAVIEMAAASGLPMIPEDKRNPLFTTSFGTGELICDAMERGYRNLIIAAGGSATNDGGIGAMRAAGVRFLDGNGKTLEGTGSDLIKIRNIDMSGLHPAAADTKFTVMCDVKNPLTGPKGATYIFGKQKGGSRDVLDQLEAGMKNYAGVIERTFGIHVDELAGAGAAGGLAAALCVFLNAELKSGIETVLELIDFDGLLKNVDLVITGEGRMDWQSAFGKVPAGVGMHCKAKRIPAAAIVGSMGPGAESMYEFGIESIVTTVQGVMELDEAMERAEELYINAADRLFRMVRVGRNMRT